MQSLSPRIASGIVVLFAAAILAPAPARAEQLQITVTNDQPTGGFGLAPFWFGVQNGSFTTFTPGGTASSAVASLAQTGSTAALTTLFESQNVGVDTTLTSGGAVAQFVPGQSNSTILNVSNPSADQFLSYAAMFVPSNDFFMANATPLQIFGSNGNFLGPVTINIFASNVWDSDTEVQSTTTALTFIQGQNPGTGTQITNGAVTTLFSEPTAQTFLQSIDGLTTIAGYTISHVPTSGELVATITINAVPEPTPLLMMGIGLAGVFARYGVSRWRSSGRSGRRD
jgi:Spondin_N/PEP-CTERM motif